MEIYGYIDRFGFNLLPYIAIDWCYDYISISIGWLVFCIVISYVGGIEE